MLHRIISRAALRVLRGPAFALAILASGCAKPPLPAPPVPTVIVAQAVREEVAEYRDYTGRVEAVETEEVRARVKGFLQKIHFQEGSVVKKGDLLYEIDRQTFQADLDKAEAEMARQQTQLELMTGEAERAAKLRASRSMSEEDYRQRLAARRVAEAALQEGKAAVRSVKLELGFTQIRAKSDGKIGRTLVTQGNLVGYMQPTLLTTIVRLDPVYLYFEETEQGIEDYERLVRAKGAANIVQAKIPVQIELPGQNGSPRRGQLDFRDNKIDAGSGTIQLRAAIPNSDHALIPGQFARVRVTVGEPKSRLLVPEEALGRDQLGKFLMLVKADNTVEQRPVTTGLLQNGKIVIERGLNADEKVIVSGLQRARPGAVVVPQPEPNNNSPKIAGKGP